MRNLIGIAAVFCWSNGALAFTEIGQFGGYGFIVTKTLPVDKKTSTYSGHIIGARVGERGDATKYDIRIECASPGNIHVEEDGIYRNLQWNARNQSVRNKPMNGGYFAIYEKFCPPNSRVTQKSADCAMTDNGKLCGKELRKYRMND